MVEKCQAGPDVAFAGTVEIQVDPDIGFSRFTMDRSHPVAYFQEFVNPFPVCSFPGNRIGKGCGGFLQFRGTQIRMGVQEYSPGTQVRSQFHIS